MKTALIVVDVQQGLVVAEPYGIDAVLERISHALDMVREKRLPVIYIRHTTEMFIEGSDDWQIHERVAPQVGDVIFNKAYNSAFKETDLHDYLQKEGIEKLIFCGMLTNYCVDTSVRVAFELGYRVAVVEYGTTTFDDELIPAKTLIEYHENIWADRFAQVDDIENLIE